jgi:ribosomal-protein-alanine N-acetyltransferase
MRPPDPQPDVLAGDLILRPWCLQDAPQIVRAFRDPEIRKSEKHPPTTDFDAEQWMSRWHRGWHGANCAGWAIVGITDRTNVVGMVALRDLYLHDGVAECSYWVVADHRGRGIDPQALRALCDWAFNALGLHRMELIHSVRNVRSCRVAAKAGFGPEGIERSLHRYGDDIHDMHLHARVKPAQLRATLKDRALMDVSSHPWLCTGASVLSAVMAFLAAESRIALALPLIVIAAVAAARFTTVHEARPKPAHRRRAHPGSEDTERPVMSG